MHGEGETGAHQSGHLDESRWAVEPDGSQTQQLAEEYRNADALTRPKRSELPGAGELLRNQVKSSIQRLQEGDKGNDEKQFPPVVVVGAEELDASYLNRTVLSDELYEWSIHDAAHN